MTDSKTVVEDLAAWFTQIWDEEERLAKRVAEDQRSWTWRPDAKHPHYSGEVPEIFLQACNTNDPQYVQYEAGEHIAYHDPASVLARIATDRAILAEFVARDKDVDLMLGPDCLRQREWSGLRLALRLKAEQYKDRPGFNPEWLDRSQGSRSHP